MSIFSALAKLIIAIIKAVIRFVVKFIKKYWWIILIVAAIWFAPLIAATLAEWGAPTWLSGAFSSLSSLTPALQGYLTTAWNWVSTGVQAGWEAFKTAEVGTRVALITGAAAAIAPEETAGLISEVVTTAADVVGTVASSLFSSPAGLVAVGLGLWFLLGRKRETVLLTETVPTQGEALNAAQ